MAIKKGSEVDLDIEGLAFGGRGIARVNGYVVFVDNALPGQRVTARIFRKRKGYAEARTLEVVKTSSEEVKPQCNHFGECGGCKFQNLAYESQIKYKQQQVIESLEHIGGFKKPPVSETLASPEKFYYRNKMEYSFGCKRWLSRSEIEDDEVIKPREFALGLHVRGRFDKILDLDECHLQSKESVEILQFVKEFALESEVPAYSTDDHSGYWRHLVIREGKKTGQLLLNIVTADIRKHESLVAELAEKLQEQFQSITTIVHNINRKKAQVATGDVEHVLYGPGVIREKIGERVFQISANSFFQTNTRGAEILYEQIVQLTSFEKEDIVYDLYCGAGSITVYIADRVQQVIGFELSEEAVKDAEVNSKLNKIENCRFVAGDLKDLFKAELSELSKWGTPSTIIVDPPRAGLHENVVHGVLKLLPEKIIYVSCNPTTFARDVKTLCHADYQLKQVQPVDMFPMTTHIELVGLLKRK